ncbi:MAG: hypothetical protein AAGE59_29000 [Cyanobacteria bacterium P01_F01_bin.86]
MDEFTRFVSSLSDQKRIESEMLHAILLDNAAYPWNPAEVPANSPLNKLEATVESGQVESRWSSVSRQAEQLWAVKSVSV